MILQTVEKHCECAQFSKKSLKFTNIKMEDMMIAMNRLEIVEEPVVIIEEPEGDDNSWDDGLVAEPRWDEAR